MVYNSQSQRFSLRKSAFGLCSVLLGTLALLGAETARADQLEIAPSQEVVLVETVAEDSVEVLSELLPEAPILEFELELPVGDLDADALAPVLAVNSQLDEVMAEPILETEADLVADLIEPALETSEEPALPELVVELEEELLFSPSQGVIGDDYPAKWKHLDPDANIDDWGMYVRYCTSFVAYRLSTANGFNLPRGYGNAGEWASRARAEGYLVDGQPVRGAVAWSQASADNCGYGHVAWVAAVDGDMVTVEEYNYGKRHAYNTRTVHKNNFTGYIHFKDLTGPGTASQPLTTGTINIRNINDQTGDFDVVVTDVFHTNGVTAVKLPIWSAKGGQDDIIWYDAQPVGDRTYKISVKTSNHRHDTGKYHVHMYYQKPDGQLVWGGLKDIEIKAGQNVPTSGQISVTNHVDTGNFDVYINDLSHNQAIHEVVVPIWSDKDGQDDIVWYKAKKQADGRYKVSVDISQHKGNRGLYHIHLYYGRYDDQLVGVGSTTTTVAEPPKKPTAGNLTYHQNRDTGNFEVWIGGVSHSQSIAAVLVPIWSDKGGQDDIIWYEAARQADGRYKVAVDISKHRQDTGLYHVHLYYRQTNGQLIGVDGSGNRHVTVERTNRPQETIPAQGTYHFNRTLPIKNQASLSAQTLGYYYAGESVHYDRVLTAEGRQWISYLSHSGARRYIPLN